MIIKRCHWGLVGVLWAVGTSWGQVRLSYAPTMLDPNVSVQLRIRLHNDTGADFGVGAVFFGFSLPAGVTATNFMWLNGLDDSDVYFATDQLPGNVQTAFISGGAGVTVPGGGSLEIGEMTVTAAASAAGSMLTVQVFPASNTDAVITGTDFEELDITAGRSVTFTVSGTPIDDNDNDSGSGGGGGGGGGGSGGSNDNGNTSGANDNVTVVDGNDNVEDDDGVEDDNGNANDRPSTNLNSNDDDEESNDNRDDVLTNSNGNDNSVGEANVNDNSDSSGNGNGGASAPSRPRSLCGLGMIGFGLFTLAGLSVMKLARRGTRSRSG